MVRSAGVTYVIHQASPLGFFKGDPVKDAYDPAIKGVTSIVESVHKLPAVKKIVFTSSVAAIARGKKDGQEVTEADWNPVTYDQALEAGKKAVSGEGSGMEVYTASKALAERALWKSAGDASKRHFSVTSINPVFIIGPAVVPEAEVTGTNGLFYQFVGTRPVNAATAQGVPASLGWVDVRDTARAHVVALHVKASDEKRYLAAAAQPSLAKASQALLDAGLSKEAGLPFDPKEATGKENDDTAAFPYVNGSLLEKDLGFNYLPFAESARDFFRYAATFSSKA